MEEYYDGVVAKPELDELYHHGVLGMHWGVRNGPPYPLGSDVSTGKRLKSGAAGSVKKTKKKLAKASVKAAKSNKKAAKASNSLLHPVLNYHKNAYQSKAFKNQAKVDKLQNKLAKEEKKEAKREEISAIKDQYDYKSKDTVSEREKVLDNLYVKDPKTGKRGDGSTTDPNSKEYQRMKKALNYSEDPKMATKLDAEMKKAAKTEGAEVYDFNAKNWVDAHTKTRETKNPDGAARMGEIDHNGNIIRTQKQMMDETIYRTTQAQARKVAETANSNQDMFNDILDRTSNGPSMKKDGQNWRTPEIASADKEFSKLVKQVAKEAGVNRRDLESKILESYEKRNSEIAKKDAARQDQKRAQEKKETINRRLQNAKTLDQWDWNFLEAVQNAPWTEANTLGEMSDSAYKNKMLQEYKKYLEDPEKYWKNR